VIQKVLEHDLTTPTTDTLSFLNHTGVDICDLRANYTLVSPRLSAPGLGFKGVGSCNVFNPDPVEIGFTRGAESLPTRTV
jgi:hypothetical protein